MKYETKVPVAASRAALWQALTRVTEWPAWTRSMGSVEPLDAQLRQGARVRVRQPRLRDAVYTVDQWEPHSTFGWTTHSPGAHVRAVHAVDDDGGQVVLRLSMAMSGPAAGIIGLLLGRRLRSYIDLEADGLRRFVEQIDAGHGA